MAVAAFYSAPVLAAPPAPMFNWSGFYVGGNAGGAWGRDPVQMHSGTASGDGLAENNAETLTLHSNAFVGGIQAGYNWQAGSWVLGLESDFNSLRLRASQGPATFPYVSASTFTVSQSVRTNWLFTARPRLGFAANSLLIYATGGVAVTDLHYNESILNVVLGGGGTENASLSKTETGWTAGGGVELALPSNWSVRAEYLHAEFGGGSVSGVHVNPSVPPGVHTLSRLSVDMVRAALNYRFGH
jgi:outer membrane immunogenic protein